MKLAINSYSTQNSQLKQTTFKSIYMANFNTKYKSIEKILGKEIEAFTSGANNTIKIGEGVGGETFRFTNPLLSKLVIKINKPNYNDNYDKEYDNLKSIPTDKIGGQEAVARVYDRTKHQYYLVSTLVEGKVLSRYNNFSDSHLKSLFDKMFELDKLGIYHGDLNGNNILLNNSGEVNFIDYQWTQQISKSDYFRNKEILLPKTNFPENAQMVEMALLPWYIDQLVGYVNKEHFLTKYLKHKSNYHKQRADFIQNNKYNLVAYNGYSTINDAINYEKAKAAVYKNPSSDVLKLEMKKIQFLSDYRDAYSHLDPNNPDRNILPSSSSYLCSLSAIQDFRKEISSQAMFETNSDKKKYLESMNEYGNYWYNNLLEYSTGSFNYIIRATSKQLKPGETKHQFYLNSRNPHNFEPNRDILKNAAPGYAPAYAANFDIPYNLSTKISNLYSKNIRQLDTSLYSDEKTYNKIKKLISVSDKTNLFYGFNKYLDLLNISQLGILKIREFRSFARENISNNKLNSLLNKMLDDSINFTQELYKKMHSSLEENNTRKISVKGYNNMRDFCNRI